MAETRPKLTDEYVEQVQKALDEMMGKITNPQEPTEVLQDDNKTTVQRTEEELESKKDQSISNLENSNCCCMLEEWIIEEKDREFKLEVVKDEKWLKSDDLEFKGSNKNPRANKLNYRKNHQSSILYVVTSPASTNGNVTYKELTTKHIFKKKSCDLKILAKKGKQELYLKEGDVLEIDSNGDIIEQKSRKDKEIERYVAPKPKYPPVDIPIPEGQRIRTYRDQPKPFSVPIFEEIPKPKFPVDNYVIPYGKRVIGYKDVSYFDKYISVPIPETYMKSEPIFSDIEKPKYEVRDEDKVTNIGQQIRRYVNVSTIGHRRSTWRNKKVFEYESYPIFEDIPNMPQDNSSFITLIKTLVNPFSVVEEPITLQAKGSSKCLNKKVIIYPIEHLEADIEMIMDFALTDRLKVTKNTLDRASKKDTFEVVESSFKIEGKGIVKRGSVSYEFAKSYEKENSKQVTRKEAKSFFRGIREPISYFYDFFNEAERKKNKSTIFSFSPGNSQFFVKIKGLKVVESQENYGRDWEGKVEVAIVLFNGSGGKLDLINLIISRGDKKISTFVEECRERLKKGYSSEHIEGKVELEANLVLGGGITGMVSWDKKVGADIVAEGECSGAVSLALETKVHVEARVWELKASAGAEIKTTSEKDTASPSEIKASLKASKGTNGADLDWTGDVMFTGFGIYWGMYAELEWKKDKRTTSNGKVRGGIKNIKTPKFTAEGSLVLLKEHSFWSKVMHDMPNQTYKSDVPSHLLK